MIKVAYVEDQVGIRRSVCKYLESTNKIQVVYESDNGNELIAFLRDNTTLQMPDVCIVDISMPKMDGLTLLKTIRSSWNRLPCVVYSMHANANTVQKAIHLGVKAYLTKENDYEVLYQAILEVIKNGFAYSDVAPEELFIKIRERHLRIPNITNREREFITLACTDHSYAEIARIMKITEKTAEGYRTKCYGKLKVNTRVGLALQAVRLGIINL